jgi:hypothetical protein
VIASASCASVGRFDQQCRIACDLRDRARTRNNDRKADGHRLEHRKTEAFVDRRYAKRGPSSRALGDPRRSPGRKQDRDAASGARRPTAASTSGRAGPAGDHEVQIGCARCDRSERGDQVRQVLRAVRAFDA